jgi:hypothetical protein
LVGGVVVEPLGGGVEVDILVEVRERKRERWMRDALGCVVC